MDANSDYAEKQSHCQSKFHEADALWVSWRFKVITGGVNAEHTRFSGGMEVQHRITPRRGI